MRRPNKPSAFRNLKNIAIGLIDLMRPRKGAIALAVSVIIVNRMAGIVLPASTKFVVDDIVQKKSLTLLREIVALVVLSCAAQSVSSLVLTRVLSRVAHELIADTRKRLQRHVSQLPLTYYDETKTGSLLSRVMWDIDCVSNLVGIGLAEFLGGLLSALFAFVVLMRINVAIACVVMILVVGLATLLTRSFRKIRPMFLERKRVDAEVVGRLSESIAGVRVVKGYHAHEREHRVFSTGVQRILTRALQTLDAVAALNAGTTVFVGLIGVSVMYLGVSQVIAGRISLGEYFTATMFAALLVAPLQQVITIGVQITESLAGIHRTREILRQPTEDMDVHRGVSIGKLEGWVEFRNVEFSYDRGKKVLHNISFHANPGTVTAFIGPSGSGKSTLIGLIASFYRPDSGTILVDGLDLSQVTLESYRTQLGLVLQESFLFDGSIRDNVSFSRPDAADAEVMYACRMACVDEFAQKFPDGYGTVIGERGIKLSGGQRQRISIARAILANPRILILDEATSSLDTESESLIQEGLSHLMRGRTTFVIAHRLSTVRSADQILVIEGGKIVECGNHSHLYASNGRYFEMYTRQNGIELDLLRTSS